ncbi:MULTISPECIES: hypothetical protein [Nitrincola]|uniref:Uncharacterized protein n=1 Tax=Nitrincola nitratireducens TaxID=1229521 RepID=W9UYS7_9GAMM|nr:MULTISPECIES: hypothetical protein [Nitrincola]EXJ09062.1 hypothetical protein D791_04009 [Nitrincola nitratireducens]
MMISVCSLNLRQALFVLICIFLLSACASFPLGMNEAEWQSLTSEQQLKARQQQAELDKAAEIRRSAEAAARKAEVAKHEAEIEGKRSNAAYGERLQCILQPAEAWLNRKWRVVQPQALDLVLGEELPFAISETKHRTIHYGSEAYAHFKGQELALCRFSEGRGPCARILGNFSDYHRGIRQDFHVEQFLRGHLRCQLVPTRK